MHAARGARGTSFPAPPTQQPPRNAPPYPYPSPEQAAAYTKREAYPANFPAPKHYVSVSDVFIPDFSPYSLASTSERRQREEEEGKAKQKRPCPPPSLFPFGQQVYPGLYIGGISAMLNQEFLQLADISHILVIGPNITNPYPETDQLQFLSLPTIVHKEEDSEGTRHNEYPGLRVPTHPMPELPLYYDAILRKKRVRENANKIRLRQGLPLLPQIGDDGEELGPSSEAAPSQPKPKYEALSRQHLEKAFRFIHEGRFGSKVWTYENETKFGLTLDKKTNDQAVSTARLRQIEEANEKKRRERFEQQKAQFIAALRARAKLDPSPDSDKGTNKSLNMSNTSVPPVNKGTDTGPTLESINLAKKLAKELQVKESRGNVLSKVGNVLVVSYDGNTRAAAVACAYLMRILGVAPQTALGYVKSQRPTAQLTQEHLNLLEELYYSGTWDPDTQHEAHVEAYQAAVGNPSDSASRTRGTTHNQGTSLTPDQTRAKKSRSKVSALIPKSQHFDLWRLICCGNSIDRAAAGSMMGQSFASALAFSVVVTFVFMVIVLIWKGRDLWVLSERVAAGFQAKFIEGLKVDLDSAHQQQLNSLASQNELLAMLDREATKGLTK